MVDRILERRNITRDSLKKEREDYLKWEDMDRVVDKVASDLIISDRDYVVGILYDVDVDGLFSGYILEDYLTRREITVKRYMNKQKQHGLVDEAMKWVKENKFDWLFIVDAGSGDRKQIREITDTLPTKVVVLDHHPYEAIATIDSTKSWILNVKDDDTLPSLSGCGVVYRFVEKLGNLFGDLTGQYQKFVGITVLSDMCDMSEKENRYYVKRAYEEYRGNYFLQQFPFYGSGKSFYSFGVIPYLNACIRVGEENHAMDFVNNMNRKSKMNIVKRDRYRVLEKQAQMEQELFSCSKEIVLDGITLLLRRGNQELRPVGGLVANKLIGKYQQPALVLHREGNVWKGSFRGNFFDRFVLEEYGFKTMGHDKACGIEVNNSDLKEFRKTFAYTGKKDKTRSTIVTSINKIKDSTWKEIAEFNEFAGEGNLPITVRIKEGVSGSSNIDDGHEKKREIYFENHVITDFTKKTDDALIVEPILRGTNYQLLRV